jgi:hypothetical protein
VIVITSDEQDYFELFDEDLERVIAGPFSTQSRANLALMRASSRYKNVVIRRGVQLISLTPPLPADSN